MQTTPTLSQVAVLYGKDRYTILDIAQVAGIPVREGRLMLDEAIEHADGNWTRDDILGRVNGEPRWPAVPLPNQLAGPLW